ncbi:MAG: NAD(P)-dependent alcohol dehydrogenase [Acidobacteria bacterium]|nr:NAD(P)-dependent alcohol dehydrogenase [Acidobacteriota bacterium]
MKAYEIEKFGFDGLVLTDRPQPEAKAGQVLLKMKAASLNYRDLMTVKGQYNPRLHMPQIPLSDGVGEVVAVGEGVTRIKVGDRVANTFFEKWVAGELTEEGAKSALGAGRDGVLAEYVALDEDGVIHVPAHLSDEAAATLPCAALTAWAALITYGKLKAGDTILAMGTGGVSIFALQFAALSGARVIITSSSDAKLERARQLGASDVINYRTTPDWEKEVLKLTGGRGVDHVVEVGGAGTFAKSIRAARRGGTISLIGVLAGGGETNLMPILMNGLTVQGIFVGSRQMFETMNAAIALHRMKPVVDQVFGFEEAPAAYQMMAAGAHFGKICIRF